jgi:UDP-N-acetylmuramate--alanine ligase
MASALGRPLTGRHVHFVGIGGVGMAALAELLMELGYEISGSDIKLSRTVQRLIDRGASIDVGRHSAEHLRAPDHVVYNAAVARSNPEVEAARERGIDVMSRAQLLGRVFDAGRGVAVTGTHGKTTTSSMLAHALRDTGFDPSFLIGGDLNDVGSGAALGSSDLVVAEADEAFGSFLELRAELAVVTNIDLDHLEHYADQAAIDDAFATFLDKRHGGGWAILCGDDPGIRRLLPRVGAPVATYGFGEADLSVAEDGTVRWHGRRIGVLRLSIPGRHNLSNAAGALAAALTLGADADAALDALRTFSGVERRFSVRGEAAGVVVVDDYAHNPAKVRATISAAREAYPHRRIVVLFQPHLYSRTLHLAERFGSSFEGADVIVVTDVYGDREQPMPGVSGRLVSDAVRARADGAMVLYIPRLEEAPAFVASLAYPGDVVLTLGAGDVTTAAPRILELLRDEEQ